MGEIKFPITVEGVEFSKSQVYKPGVLLGGKTGDFVSIRPVSDNPERKSYLGVLLGEIALSLGVAYNNNTKHLEVNHYMYNPAIFVFDLNRIVFGAESWWGPIKSPEDLRQISDYDIENVWYVKAMKTLQKKGGDDPAGKSSGNSTTTIT